MSSKTCIFPDYYDRFRCKGGACRNSCCAGWGISVSMIEYFRLIGLECSPRLHARLECAFHPADAPSPERYALISPNWRGDCPMHAEDGLCMLHRECGEDALPAICRMYPRSVHEENGIVKCVCSASCEAVVEALIQKEDPLTFSFRLEDAPLACSVSADERLPEASRTCLRLLQDRMLSLPARLERIGLLMRSFEKTGRFEIDETLPVPEPWPTERALKAIVCMLCRLSESSPSLRRFGEAMLTRYHADDEALYALYLQDKERFETRFPKWPRYFENLLVNHIFYEDFPFTDSRLTPTGEYTALVGVYAAMRVMSIGSLSLKSDLNTLIDVLAGLFRCIEHASFYLNADYLLECEEQGDSALLGGALRL